MWRPAGGRRRRLRPRIVGDAVAVDDDAVVARLGAGLEGLVDDRLVARPGLPPGRGVHPHEADARRNAEGGPRLVLEGARHEVAEDWRRIVRPFLARAE